MQKKKREFDILSVDGSFFGIDHARNHPFSHVRYSRINSYNFYLFVKFESYSIRIVLRSDRFDRWLIFIKKWHILGAPVQQVSILFLFQRVTEFRF